MLSVAITTGLKRKEELFISYRLGSQKPPALFNPTFMGFIMTASMKQVRDSLRGLSEDCSVDSTSRLLVLAVLMTTESVLFIPKIQAIAHLLCSCHPRKACEVLDQEKWHHS